MTITVIIPTFNEEGTIGSAVRHMLNDIDRPFIAEVIVVDGHSGDNTVQEAKDAGARVVRSPMKGRASQMNVGAAVAESEVLYFVHADSRPAIGFGASISNALASGYDLGCMRLKFDRDHRGLRVKAWFTRFHASFLHYGDQSLFVRRELFCKVGGYREAMTVFEDLDMIERLRKHGRFTVLPGPIISSARKYEANSALRMQSTFYIMYPLYRFGVKQEKLTRIYKRLVRQDKI